MPGSNTTTTQSEPEICQNRGGEARKASVADQEEGGLKEPHLELVDGYVSVSARVRLSTYKSLGVLAFVVIGGIFFELVRMFF
jgi:hypothetical protein